MSSSFPGFSTAEVETFTTDGRSRLARSAKLDGTERGAGTGAGDGCDVVCACANGADSTKETAQERARRAVNLLMVTR
ncbi:hypothetical protein Gbth_006_039 [Gluconobacter thailandicus F149-1 = NBRC 100600]|nr:hypothetical protein Gbth_006_039 [Gluconobacter thailandicus F149-1 = NBRC 100600]GEL87997.1 hypothetical protein GTH01_23550 [Gluconobacter thailandicus F149-1 = NBRC 100600]